jgi:hypothetical protein
MNPCSAFSGLEIIIFFENAEFSEIICLKCQKNQITRESKIQKLEKTNVVYLLISK